MAFSFLDLIREADGDENQNAAPDTAADNAANDNNQQQGNQQNDQNQNAGNDNNDDFNMDMSLEDDGGGDEGEGGGDDAAADTGGEDVDTGASGNEDNEPIEANTDIFYSLSAEEQRMKINVLKKQYLDLFNASDDLIEKISDMETNEKTIVYMTKISSTLMALKDYITDYLYNKFDSVSFYENDVKFNEFEAVFYVIKNILEDIYKINIQNE